MSAITSQKYALALAEAAQEQPEQPKQIEKIVSKFIQLLKKHHRLADLPAIIKQLEYYYQNSPRYSLKVELQYAGENPTEQLKAVLQKKHPSQDISLKARQNSRLIAGARLIIGNQLFDNSVQAKLSAFKKRVNS